MALANRTGSISANFDLNGVASIAHTHTPTSGTPDVVFIGLSIRGSPGGAVGSVGVASLTYGSKSLSTTPIRAVLTGAHRVLVFAYAGSDIPSGGQTVTATFAAFPDQPQHIALEVVTYDGADQTTPNEAEVDDADADPLILDITTLTDGAEVVSFANCRSGGGTLDPDNGQTLLGATTTGGGGTLHEFYSLPVPTAGATTNRFSSVGATNSVGIAVSVKPASGGGGTTQPIGQATSQELAQAVVAAKAPALGMATSQELAQPTGAAKLLALGLTTEQDVPLGVTRTKARAVGLATETDSAFAAAWSRAKALGLTTEQDVALAVAGSSAFVVGLAVEQDVPFAVARLKNRAVGLVAEQDVALGITASSGAAIGIATEQDVALATSHSRARTLGLAVEDDVSLPAQPLREYILGLATEQDLAPSARPVRIIQVGQSTEQDLAQALSYARSVALGLATETDRALAVIVVGGATLIVGKYAVEHAEAYAAVAAAEAAGYSVEHGEAFAAVLEAGR